MRITCKFLPFADGFLKGYFSKTFVYTGLRDDFQHMYCDGLANGSPEDPARMVEYLTHMVEEVFAESRREWQQDFWASKAVQSEDGKQTLLDHIAAGAYSYTKAQVQNMDDLSIPTLADPLVEWMGRVLISAALNSQGCFIHCLWQPDCHTAPDEFRYCVRDDTVCRPSCLWSRNRYPPWLLPLYGHEELNKGEVWFDLETLVSDSYNNYQNDGIEAETRMPDLADFLNPVTKHNVFAKANRLAVCWDPHNRYPMGILGEYGKEMKAVNHIPFSCGQNGDEFKIFSEVAHWVNLYDFDLLEDKALRK